MGSTVPSLAVFLLSPVVPALSCAKHWRRDPAGTAHVGEALFQGLPGLLLARRQGLPPLRSCSMALLCRRGPLVRETKPLSDVSCRTSATSDSCRRRCILLTRRLVVSGHLSTNSALLIDLSAEPAESFLPYSWQTEAPLHAGTRLATCSCRTPRARSLCSVSSSPSPSARAADSSPTRHRCG